MANNKNIYGEDILRLRGEGKKYREIAEILGCNESTVSYHICDYQEKYKIKNRKYRKDNVRHPCIMKLYFFSNRVKKENKHKDKMNRRLNNIYLRKLQDFCKKFKKGCEMKENKDKIPLKDLLDKIGDSPTCYLTGEPIDIYQSRTYQFDHIIPVSKGGDNTLDNLGICIRDANMAKCDMSLDEFYSLCEKVLAYRDKKSQPPTDIDG